MRTRPLLLATYRLLLQLYPPVFRARFAAEMLDLAAEAELAEWPLIFGDTGLAIMRSWLDITVAPASATPNAYLSLGESRLSVPRLFQGFALTVVLVLCLCYVSALPYWELPPDVDCTAPLRTTARR
ncbi:MAG TPA: hypothetical protein VFO39_08605 [Candidatus Sulfotelmatobacter sp.]|nr:hypothetical protein [Candidatus Sulfotelmatobacter sp.]